KKAVEVVDKAVNFNGPSVVIFESPCIALFKPDKKYVVNDRCIACKKCLKEIGCPAMSITDGKVVIEPSTCYGCGLCEKVCPFDAIGGEK
ncbi:MAG: 4Fe-4S binding protein, partial [Bacillota bacterium]|nr:4Fe-4S binding protein [Bacillota bacterium]